MKIRCLSAVFIVTLPLSLWADFITIDRDVMLNKHNDLRAKHFNKPLKYSTAIEKSSARWALKLAKEQGCKIVHSYGKIEGKVYGENLFWSSARIQKSKKSSEKEWTITRSAQSIDEAKPVQDWYDEIAFYDYERGQCEAGQVCGHYTQVVWKNSKEVGCAAYMCDDKSQVWVCQYLPAGNYIGQKPY